MGPPTEGERRSLRLISQVTGQRGGRCSQGEASAALFYWLKVARRALSAEKNGGGFVGLRAKSVVFAR